MARHMWVEAALVNSRAGEAACFPQSHMPQGSCHHGLAKLWPLVLGLLISAAIQMIVSRAEIAKLLGDSVPRSI